MNLFRLLTLFTSKFELKEIVSTAKNDLIIEEDYFKYSYKENHLVFLVFFCAFWAALS
jgi:hypothetical protein